MATNFDGRKHNASNLPMYASQPYASPTEFTRLYDINGKQLAALGNVDKLYHALEFLDPLKIFTGSSILHV